MTSILDRITDLIRRPAPRREPSPSAFVRNRPILRSPVMRRLDELFADPTRNATIYEKGLADRPAHLTPEYVRELFAEFCPDDGSSAGATADDVIEHVFDHILGSGSWWGDRARSWRGEEIFAAAFADAFERAREAGNVPIRTYHLQTAVDGNLSIHVLGGVENVSVIVVTPPVPDLGGVGPRGVKLTGPTHTGEWRPTDPSMPEVSSYTRETIVYR